MGVPALLALDFQQRAARLKALAKFLMERKEALYAVSHHTGATRADSWIDVEGGAGTLFAYASMGSNELPSGNLIHEGPAIALGKKGQFAGTHVLVPRRGVAVHINAFNFPIWGALEKFAPSFLAGMPCIVKPATSTSYLTEAMVRLVVESGLLPEGALQLVVGSTGDLLDRVDGRDIVTFTGSADTAARLRVRPNLIANSVPFNAEADSLNCAVLADDVTPDDVEFDLFVKEVAREMTAKAGQKCTAIRRAIVPRKHLDAVIERLKARLAKVVVGDPSIEGVTMGALASHDQQIDVADRVAQLAKGNTVLFGGDSSFAPRGAGTGQGAFFAPTLLLCERPDMNSAAHDIEAFGPVSTLMPYDDFDQALALAERGRGSLVGTLVTRDPHLAAQAVGRLAALHGPHPGARSRRRARVHRPRLATAIAEARRPGTRRWRRGAGRHPRRPPLPAACGRPGFADDAGRGDGRAREGRRGARIGRPPVPPRVRGPHRGRLAADASPHRHRRRHRGLRRHLGRLLLHALRRNCGKGVSFRQAHRARLLRTVGRGGAVRVAGRGPGARELRPRHAALRQAGGHRRHHSPPASPASARSTATAWAPTAAGRAWWPGTWK